MDFLLSSISLTIWIYLIFLYSRQDFGINSLFWTNKIIFENFFFGKKEVNKLDKANLCIVIPARNESKNITKTLDSILRQSFKQKYILIVDDNSTDKTSEKSEIFLKRRGIKNFKILKGKKLPVGWSGKVWALYQAVDFLKNKKFSHFLFLDSDIKMKENTIANTLEFLDEKKLIMVSLMAKLKCDAFWEKLLIPSFIYFFQKIYPFSKVNNKKNNLAAAAGGFILCKSSAFKEENLYAKIKDRVIDDCNIAKLLKEKGNIWLGLTDKISSQRNYKKLSEIWKMVTRTAFEQLNHSLFLVIFSIIGMLIIYIFPYFNLFNQFSSFKKNEFLINLITIFLMTFSLIPTIRFYKLRFYYSFSLPISAFFYIFMTLNSAFNYTLRGGNIWKGRKY